MTDTKHTPGPWSPFIVGRTIAVDLGGVPRGKTPCIINWSGFDSCGLPFDEQKANARLIAAAPDLLEALQLAVHVRGTSDDTPKVLNQMQAAIAKATGEQP